MANQQINKTPFYYVKKRLFKNKAAVFGLTVIVVAHIIALLGYLIMPDDTPNATDGAVQLAKQTPVFTVKILKVRKNMEIEKVGILTKMFKGQESSYTIFPFQGDLRVESDSVYFVPFSNKANKELGMPLLDCVKPLFVGAHPNFPSGYNFRMEGEQITYIDIHEQEYKISKEQLEKEFWENNVEERTHYLGTDKSGRDMFSRLLFGTRISLSIGFIAVMISLFVGVSFGALAGFFGGKIDAIILWFMTVIWSIPTIMLVIAISLALQQRGIWVAFVAVGLTMWVDIARVVRGQIMSIKQKQFVEAARAFGFSNRRIIFKHIMPNIFGPLIVISTSNFASAILIEAGLSFLGLGVAPPMPSWGVMINEGFQAFATQRSWHLIWLPSFCISLMVLAFNLFGNGLRDAYDPKTLS